MAELREPGANEEAAARLDATRDGRVTSPVGGGVAPGAAGLGVVEPPRLDETRVSGVVLVEPRRLDETRVSGPIAATATSETRVRSDVVFADETRVGSGLGFVDERPAEDPVVPVGARIGRFVVLRELGRGAMGVVFAAYDEELDRKVAIKLLHAGGGENSSNGRAMLLREAQAMAKLSHPNVVAVHEVGVIGAAVFVAMEYVAGVDLQKWLAAEVRPWRAKVAALLQAGEGLAAAHREGLVHRDFKPSNVLVGEDGRVRVADFGLAARRSGAAEVTGLRRAHGALTETLTGEGALIGTPLYMAPELLRGRAATGASDQYAFCVALWEALYGARPFDADTLPELTKVVEQRALPATPPRGDVPVWLFAAVSRGLAKAPEDRWPSLTALMELLARDPEAERRLRRRRALQIAGSIAATAAIVALLIFVYGAVRRYAAERQAEGRLTALRGQVEVLRGRGEVEEARRLLQTFVGLPDNRGSVVIARAYLEWAAAQEDHAAAIEAYGSAYIAARTPEDGQAALLGLIDRLSARGQVKEAAAALVVLGAQAPAAAQAPGLQAVRLASALARRDLAGARAALLDDPDGWGPVFEDLSHVTAVPAGRFGGVQHDIGYLSWIDFDGDGVREIVGWDRGSEVKVYRAGLGLELLRTIPVGPVAWVRATEPVIAGEPLLITSQPGSAANTFEMRVLAVDVDDSVRTIDAWQDSIKFSPVTVDFDGDGRRELYIGTEAYARKFWRMERGADGVWTRRSAHRPTDAIDSDLLGVLAADFEGDGRRELVALAGPWRAYDARVYKPTTAGELDQVARKAFGSYSFSTVLRAGDRELVAFLKRDEQIAPNRFPPDRPLGEPGGLYIVGFKDGAIDVQGHLPFEPVNGPSRALGTMHAGDLDGDGFAELVIDGKQDGVVMIRPRADRALEPLMLAGLRPLMTGDLDGDGDAEIVVRVGDEQTLLVLGAGEARLEPLPVVMAEPRAVPGGIEDPAIAEAWAHAEQLAAIGLPRRTADELAAIAGLAGHVAPDMLLRTAELYAATGADALAADSFVAAATRPDIAAQALAGAAQARRRLGQFAEAEALTRRLLAVVADDERAAVETELAQLAAAAAAKPGLTLTFARPLDGRWRVADPVAVRRSLGRGLLSVWASPTPVVAEFPLVWTGGPAALEVELETDVVEWGTEIGVEVVGPGDVPWLSVKVGAFGVSDAPEVRVKVTDVADFKYDPVTSSRLRGRVAAFPALGTTIRELTMGDEPLQRVVLPLTLRSMPVAAPPVALHLRVTSKLIKPGFVAHVGISSILLTGFTAGEASGTVDEAARLLVEGEYAGAAAAAASTSAARGSVGAVWRIEALLGLGDVAAASMVMKEVLATPADGPVQTLLRQRLRRDEPIGRLAARAAFGDRLVDLLLLDSSSPVLRPGDVEAVLTSLAAPPTESPKDPEALAVVTRIDLARGLAHEQAGQLTAARTAYAAAFARVEAGTFPASDRLRRTLMVRRLAVAVALHDADAALSLVRMQVTESATPYLTLERLQSDAALAELLGAEVWATLLAETRAARP